jgi:hypothetical protein
VKSDRTQQWIALGQTAPAEMIGVPTDSTDDSWSMVRAGCVAPVVQLIRASRPRVFAISVGMLPLSCTAPSGST